MSTLSFKAHYDGQKIVLDEPCDLPVNEPLVVFVRAGLDNEGAEWIRAGEQTLAAAFGEDEPDYSSADLKP